MGDTDFDTDFVGQVLEVLFENVMAGTITATTVTRHQNGSGLGIMLFAISVPPVTKAITSKFTGVMAGPDLDIANIEAQIVQTMRNNDAFGKTGEIMIVGLDFFQSIQMSFSIEIAQIFLFFACPY